MNYNNRKRTVYIELLTNELRRALGGGQAGRQGRERAAGGPHSECRVEKILFLHRETAAPGRSSCALKVPLALCSCCAVILYQRLGGFEL